jgi:glycosyltransferase involved in cell wall biosynthesis
MKVALVHDFLNQWGGAERVLLALHEMYPEAPIFTLMHDSSRTKEHFAGLDIRPSFLQRPFIARLRKYTLPLYPLAVESFDLKQYDLVISSSNSYAKGVLTGPETVHICYCHTPTAYLWSWTHQYLAEQRLSKLSSPLVRLLLYNHRQWDRLAAERVDEWVANSKNVQERIKKYYRKDSTVIYPPVDVDRFSISTETAEYYLFVGRLSGYKRVDLVIEAFNRLKQPIYIVGEGDERERLARLARPNITFKGWLSDEEVAVYLSRCRALIFPVEEDFGIVPVEAMAAGRPVIAFGRGGALETVVDGKTGVFFDLQTVDSLVAAVRHFQKNETSFHPRSIRAHALKFDRSVFSDRMRRFINGYVR